MAYLSSDEAGKQRLPSPRETTLRQLATTRRIIAVNASLS
jgi:hypothetical protein